ncbi:MAG TPA: HAMP domain-containing sensor histidine kinase [Pyrinomonadaceae bacterium]
MKRSWFPILIISILVALLATLGVLQYNWVRKIGEDERERMQKRVATDTERFAEDFNREIQNAYYNFQTGADIWRDKNWAEFNERFDFWREKTAYPNLIKNFYYWANEENPQLLLYDAEKREFVETIWTDELKSLQEKTASEKGFQPVRPENFALVMPIQEIDEKINRVIIHRENEPRREINLPKKIGFLLIALDENVIKNQLFPDLANKYFPDKEFNLAVRGADDQTVFQTQEVSGSDATAKLLNLSPDNFIFFSNREAMTRFRTVDETKSLFVTRTLENRPIPRVEGETKLKTSDGTSSPKINRSVSRVESETIHTYTPKRSVETFNLQVPRGEFPRTAILESEKPNDKGIWTLNVQHSAGSIEQFINRKQQKDLAIGFSILSLLAVSIITVYVSAQRAKILAQRQVEFVSSVSHEFRTPLAVIYSAGENLADGVAKEETQVARYGNLIKGEGRKLSKMVEQILEFAGANSGKKKYDLREVDVNEIIENALAECKPLIDEKNFTVEREVAENLPKIVADKNALSQALQNLIGNSIKYSNGNSWLKISARNGSGKLKITVEDKGIGISSKDLRHIFEPFYRAKAVVDEQIHGNGLGLSLVKKTVDAHGGQISAESQTGKGSKFTIHLPLN